MIQQEGIPFGDRSPIVCGLIYGSILSFFMALCLGIVKHSDIEWVLLLLALTAFYRPVAWQAAAAFPLTVFGATLSGSGFGVIMGSCAAGIFLANTLAQRDATVSRGLQHFLFTCFFFVGYFAVQSLARPLSDLSDRILWTSLAAAVGTLIKMIGSAILQFIQRSTNRPATTTGSSRIRHT